MNLRLAGALDARQVAELINEIIEIGGTTAFTVPISSEEMAAWMTRAPERSAWHVAEDDEGDLLGFQLIEPHKLLPPEAADIATFVRVGKTGLGTGSQLFEKSCAAARQLGYSWLNASIRADNTGGRAYYQSRGFEQYGSEQNIKLQNGLIVDRIHTRFDLR